ncbi:MAG: hypothetical protein HY975_00235 [Candidatus Kerfeldbacteria bacterium]|nr:hypothetical protein [Candidatus Kerfeldbacteria bacterium]
MHVYFYGPRTKQPERRSAYVVIKEALRLADVYVSTNTEEEEVQVSAEVMADSRERDVPLLERMDAFLFEGTTSDPEIGFLLAHAIALKKPVLYLYQRGSVPQVFSHLSRRELPKYINVVAYDQASLGRQVTEFLRSTSGVRLREVPRIKFTLRITSSIEEYLHFKTHNTKITKADYLRQEIEQTMEQDEEWQTYQHKRRQAD